MSDIGHKEKEVAFYTAIVDAWVASSLERDRSILYVASGAIGLLITLATTTQAFTRWEFLFYFVSLVAFLAAIIFILVIFQRNTVYLTRLKEDSENTVTSRIKIPGIVIDPPAPADLPRLLPL